MVKNSQIWSKVVKAVKYGLKWSIGQKWSKTIKNCTFINHPTFIIHFIHSIPSLLHSYIPTYIPKFLYSYIPRGQKQSKNSQKWTKMVKNGTFIHHPSTIPFHPSYIPTFLHSYIPTFLQSNIQTYKHS